MKNALTIFSPFKIIYFMLLFSCLSQYGQTAKIEDKIEKIIGNSKKDYYQNKGTDWNTNDMQLLSDNYDNIKDPYQKADVAFIMTQFYENTFEFEKGLLTAEEATKLYKSLGLYESYTEAVSQMCRIKRTLNQTGDIENILLQSLDLVENQNIGYHKLHLIQELTIHYSYTLNQYKKVIQYGEMYEKLVQAFYENNIHTDEFMFLNTIGINKVYLELGQSYLAVGQLNKAKTKLDKALNFFLQKNSHDNLSRIYLQKAKYAILTKYTDSLDYFYKQTYFHNEKYWGNAFLQLNNTPKHKNQILNLEKTLHSEKLLKSDLILDRLVLGIFLLLFLFILIFGYWNNKRVQRAQQQLNNALKQQVNYSNALNLEKTKYFSILSHELRTPIFAITGLTNLLKKSKNPNKEYINGIINSGNHLLQLVNNVLQLNKLETADKVSLQYECFDLAACLKEVRQTTSYFAQQKGVQIIIKHNLKKNHLIHFDKQKLIQILINLTSNAIKHSFKDDQVTLQVHLQSSKGDTDCYSFKVIDKGPGIHKDRLHKIFNYNESLDYENHKNNFSNFESIGIGLFVISKFVSAMSSKIEVQSIPNIRTEFSFNIEVNTKHAACKPVSTYKLLKTNLHVLAVDDNKINLMVTKKTLEAQGIVCFTAQETDPIIEIIQSKKINLVLMDLNMPYIDGYEWAKKIRDAGIQIPVIAHTAIIEEEIDLVKLKQMGLQDYIVKPYKLEKLIAKLNEYVKH